jgi:hypothetical protein
LFFAACCVPAAAFFFSRKSKDMRKLICPVLLAFVALAGCQPSLDMGTNPEPVEISGSVSKAGTPVDGLKLSLQPLESGLPAVIDIKAGKFSSTATPGKYTWFLSGDEAELEKRQIPQEFREGSMERTVEVPASQPLDLKID